MQSAAAGCIGDKAGLTIFETPVLDYNRLFEINLGGCRQRNPVLLQIDPVLIRIELDIHDLMWQQ